MPDSTYTTHPIQVRFTEIIPDELIGDTTKWGLQHNFHLTNLLGSWVMPWTEIREKRVGRLNIDLPQPKSLLPGESCIVRKNIDNEEFTIIRYSYLSPFEFMVSDSTLYRSKFYAESEWQSNIFTRNGINDSVKIIFDIPESQFYLRSNLEFIENEIDPDTKTILTTTDNLPSFFIYYKPSFSNEIFKIKNLSFDLLWENVNDETITTKDFSARQEANKQDINRTKEYISQIFEKLEPYTDISSTDKTFNFVVAKQVLRDVIENDSVDWYFGQAFSISEKSDLVLVDQSEFYSSVPIHEILHIVYPLPETFEQYSFYERNLIAEGIIDYMASVIYESITGEDIFSKKSTYLQSIGYTKSDAKKSAVGAAYGVFGGEGSGSLLYAHYIPCQFHRVAQKSGGDSVMVDKLVQLLRKGINCSWQKSEMKTDIRMLKSMIGI